MTPYNNRKIKDQIVAIERECGIHVTLATVTGSHMWGLARPDSDIDIRGIFVRPTMDLFNLDPPHDTIQITDGYYDIHLWEVEKALRLLRKNNGNLVEMILAPTNVIMGVPVPGVDWKDLAKKRLTKQLSNYYIGYAKSQIKRGMENHGGKSLLYTYRELFAGIMLMYTGKIIYDFKELTHAVVDYDLYPADGLLFTYLENPTAYINNIEAWEPYHEEWNELLNKLNIATEVSKLPDSIDDEGYDGILMKIRVGFLG